MEAGWEGKGDSARKNGRNNNQAGRRIDEYAINRVYACTYTAGLTLPSPSTPTPTAIQRASCGREDENENENGSRARRPIGGASLRTRRERTTDHGGTDNGPRTIAVTGDLSRGPGNQACARGMYPRRPRPGRWVPSVEERAPRPADPRKNLPRSHGQTD